MTPYDVTYSGKPHTATGSATGFGGVDLSADLTLTGTTHTDAGSYNGDAWSFHDPAGNYSDASGTVNDHIGKATAAVVVTPYSVPYDGNPHSAVVQSITGVNGETGATVGVVTLNTTHTDAGSFLDSWSFTGAANYHDIPATTLADTINQVNATITVTSASASFDSNPHPAPASATGVESPAPADLTALLHLSYKNLADNSVSASPPVLPGTYAVFASFEGNTDYRPVNSFDTGAQVVIGRSAASISLTQLQQKYSGAPIEPVVTTSPAGLATSVTYRQGSVILAGPPVHPGAYTVTATVTDPNYVATSTTGTLVVGKANVIFNVASRVATYDGLTHAAAFTAVGVESPDPKNLASLMHLSYRAGSGVISTTPPVHAGTYSVLASFDGTADYNSFKNVDVHQTVTIRPAATAFTLNFPNPIVTKGALATLSGKVVTAGGPSPTGIVTITVATKVIQATITANGAFAMTLDTKLIPVGGYVVQYAYNGVADFGATFAKGGLTIK